MNMQQIRAKLGTMPVGTPIIVHDTEVGDRPGLFVGVGGQGNTLWVNLQTETGVVQIPLLYVSQVRVNQ